LSIKPLKQNAHPKHAVDLHLKDRAQWERELFEDAVKFTVSRKAGPGSMNTKEFTDLADAMREAVLRDPATGTYYHDPKAMLYVVASDKQAFLMPHKEWPLYLHIWKAKKHADKENN